MAANFVGGIVWARVADASGRYRGVMTSTAAFEHHHSFINGVPL